MKSFFIQKYICILLSLKCSGNIGLLFQNSILNDCLYLQLCVKNPPLTKKHPLIEKCKKNALSYFAESTYSMSPQGSSKRVSISSALNQHYEEKVRPCIDLVDNLRTLGVEKDLNLPAIAVIGDQSSGKSSVLEALSGVALPRGTGITKQAQFNYTALQNSSVMYNKSITNRQLTIYKHRYSHTMSPCAETEES